VLTELSKTEETAAHSRPLVPSLSAAIQNHVISNAKKVYAAGAPFGNTPVENFGKIHRSLIRRVQMRPYDEGFPEIPRPGRAENR
jgi:hypothetical protein